MLFSTKGLTITFQGPRCRCSELHKLRIVRILLLFCAAQQAPGTELEETMKAFLAAVAAMVVIAVAAPAVLDRIGFTAADATSGSAVRLD